MLAEDAVGASKQGHNWVDETISPSTEWIEITVNPLARWLERAIQGADSHSLKTPGQRVQYVLDLTSLPEGLIPPEEAVRLLSMIHSGDALRLEYLQAGDKDIYVIQSLSSRGVIADFYMNARNGVLLSEMPKSTTGKSDNKITGDIHEDSDY